MYKPLADYILEKTSDLYPFHMPGHKRNMDGEEYSIDITEIDECDNLHNPEGILKNLKERVRALYKSEESYVLVNGSTSGILSAISAVTRYGDGIIISRNSHKSAYNAIMLRGLSVEYLYPDFIGELGINGCICPDDVDKLMKKTGYKVVYVTSPSYEGIVSDIKTISSIVHSNGGLLIVDEAHGAHFGLSGHFPESAIKLGADIVVQSIHKTLMGMTQTAILHVGEGLGDGCRKRLEYFLKVYQSSSPSYVLMASVDRCIGMLEKDGNKLFDEYFVRLSDFLTGLNTKNIHVYKPDNSVYAYDYGKLVIYSERVGGEYIYRTLREQYGIQLEMCMEGYCIAMTSCMDTDEGFLRLKRALEEIDKSIESLPETAIGHFRAPGQQRPLVYCTIAEAFEMKKEIVPLEEGVISGDYCFIYPPGIPYIVPGEIVTNDVLCDIIRNAELGYRVEGVIKREDGLYICGIIE